MGRVRTCIRRWATIKRYFLLIVSWIFFGPVHVSRWQQRKTFTVCVVFQDPSQSHFNTANNEFVCSQSDISSLNKTLCSSHWEAERSISCKHIVILPFLRLVVVDHKANLANMQCLSGIRFHATVAPMLVVLYYTVIEMTWHVWYTFQNKTSTCVISYDLPI